jgi:hypothetical protein
MTFYLGLCFTLNIICLVVIAIRVDSLHVEVGRMRDALREWRWR